GSGASGIRDRSRLPPPHAVLDRRAGGGGPLRARDRSRRPREAGGPADRRPRRPDLEMTFRRPERLLPWMAAALYAVLFVIAFGGVTGAAFMVADDCLETHTLDRLARTYPNVLDRLYAVTFKGEGEGHFKPTQDVFFTIMHAAFGNGWWVAVTLHV